MSKQLGIKRERQVKALLIEQGYWVCRAAGSLGDADLVAARAGETPMLIEVKSAARERFGGFGPRERAELLAAGQLTGFTPVLAYWPPRGKLEWIPASEWPPLPVELLHEFNLAA